MSKQSSPLGVFSHLAKLPAFLKLFWEVFRHPDTSKWMKLSVMAAIAYIFSPLDILPDPFTGIGYVDDLIFSLLVIERFILTAPGPVLVEAAEGAGLDPEQLAEDIEDAILATSAGFAMLWNMIESSRDRIVERFAGRFEEVTGEQAPVSGDFDPPDEPEPAAPEPEEAAGSGG